MKLDMSKNVAKKVIIIAVFLYLKVFYYKVIFLRIFRKSGWRFLNPMILLRAI